MRTVKRQRRPRTTRAAVATAVAVAVAIVLTPVAMSASSRSLASFSVVGGTWVTGPTRTLYGPSFAFEPTDASLWARVDGPNGFSAGLGGSTQHFPGTPDTRFLYWCRPDICNNTVTSGSYTVTAADGSKASFSIDENQKLGAVTASKASAITRPDRVSLTWTASADAQSFFVYLKPADGGEFIFPTMVSQTLPGSARSATFDGLSLSTDTRYVASVFAFSSDISAASPIAAPFNVASDAFTFTPSKDTSPPTIDYILTGTLGNNSWYRSPVEVVWLVDDPDTAVTAQIGCETRYLSTDTRGVTLTCQATSDGGTASKSVTVKIDRTLPTVSCKAVSFVFGQYGAKVSASVADATSGPAATRVAKAVGTTKAALSWRTDPPFSAKVTLTGYDKAGNSTRRACAYSVQSYSWANAKCSLVKGYPLTGYCTDPYKGPFDWGYQTDSGGWSLYRPGSGYGYRNCTDYVAWRLVKSGVKTVSRSLGNGGQWYANASSAGLKRGTTPRPGAAAVNERGNHVAYVERVNPNGTISVSEYNKGGKGFWGRRTDTPSNLGLTRFVYFPR